MIVDSTEMLEAIEMNRLQFWMYAIMQSCMESAHRRMDRIMHRAKEDFRMHTGLNGTT